MSKRPPSPERMAAVFNRHYNQPDARLYKIGRGLTGVAFWRKYTTVEIHGSEHLRAVANKRSLIAAEHSSVWDIPDADVVLRRSGHGPVHFVGKLGLLAAGYGSVLQRMGVMPVFRPERDADHFGAAIAMATADNLMKDPHLLLQTKIRQAAEHNIPTVLFPEGTRHHNMTYEVPLLPLEKGLRTMSLRYRLPVLPLGMARAGDAFVAVAGEPLEPTGVNGRRLDREVYGQAIEAAMVAVARESYVRVAALSDELVQGFDPADRHRVMDFKQSA